MKPLIRIRKRRCLLDGVGVLIAQWPDERRVTVKERTWRTSVVAVTPLEYYRVRFQSKAEGRGYWAAIFFDKDGNELTADHNDSVFASGDWHQHVFCFRAHILAAQAKIHFEPQQHDLSVRDVRVETIDRRAVREWADQIAAANPPLNFAPPQERWKYLPKTNKKLKQGERLRLVVLGDSIANDMANSAFDVLLEGDHPGSRIEVINSIRGSTGCPYYKGNGRVQDYVLRYKPDLLIIAGISHGYDADSIRSVIAQVRKGLDCEILVMTGAVASDQGYKDDFAKKSNLPRKEALKYTESFPARLQKIATTNRAAFLDLRSLWDRYVQDSGKPLDWFLRDRVHANARGRQVLARILIRFFGDQH